MKLWLYRLLVMPAVLLLLPFAAAFNPKIRKGLKDRMRPRRLPSFDRRPLWIHASSGEFEYAKPVIREMRRRIPGLPIVVSYFSPSYADRIRQFPDVDAAFCLPLDLPGPCAQAIRRVNPSAIAIARTDLWPEWLTQARRSGVPTVLFSFGYRAYGPRWLARFRFDLVDRILCLTSRDREGLNDLNLLASTQVCGDTRFDQVRYRLDRADAHDARLETKLPCLVAGSTWPEDERVLIAGLRSHLLSEKIKCMIVPHEPTSARISEIGRNLTQVGIRHQTLSSFRHWSETMVLIVDQVGLLANLYPLADFAFVGGSFRAKVHSVMEPLGAGCVTFVGPRHENSPEALQFQSLPSPADPAVIPVGGPRALEEALDRGLKRSVERTQTRAAIVAAFDRHLGASACVADEIASLIDLTPSQNG